MSIKHDARNQPYVELDTMRITWIARDEDAWDGSGGYLRLQTYRGDPAENRALHRGVELPVRSGWDLCALVAALTRPALFVARPES